MAKTKIITAAVLSLLFAIVVCQNTATVTFNILFAKVILPKAVALLLTFVVGLAVGLLLAYSLTGRRSRR